MKGGPTEKLGLVLGLALLILPMGLTLWLSGENEDRLSRAAKARGAVAIAKPIEMEETVEEESPVEETLSEVVPVEPEPPPTPSSTSTSTSASTSASTSTSTSTPTRTPTLTKAPVFAGFEDSRFQRHDALIAKLVENFNKNRAIWAGSTASQASTIPLLTVAQVKSQMLQESGGKDVKSRAAWKKDPLQANVPGDWSSYKKYVGLHRPRNRNEGSLETNLKAGIMILARKGFGVSAQPAGNKSKGRFDGWRPALQRYNGRSDLTTEGLPYKVSYANRILRRAANPSLHTGIVIRKKGDKRRRK